MDSTIVLGNSPARIVSDWNDTRLRLLRILTPYRLSYSYEYVTSYFSFRAKEQLTYSYEYNNWLALVGNRGPIAGYRRRANQTCSKRRRSSLRWPLNAKLAIKIAGDLRKQILIVFRWCNRDNYCTHMSAIAPFWPFLSILTSFFTDVKQRIKTKVLPHPSGHGQRYVSSDPHEYIFLGWARNSLSGGPMHPRELSYSYEYVSNVVGG